MRRSLDGRMLVSFIVGAETFLIVRIGGKNVGKLGFINDVHFST